MTSIPNHSHVLIVGAGPAGLMMAVQLLHQGIHPVIIDSKTRLSRHPAVIIIYPHTLEVLRQIGLSEKFLEQGNVVNDVVLHVGPEEFSHFSLFEQSEGKTPFPFILTLDQDKVERILVDYLTAHSCPVYWNTELRGITQSDSGVSINIHRNGVGENLSCDWLVGADGSDSKVRSTLHIPFLIQAPPRHVYLAEVSDPNRKEEHNIRFFLKKDASVSIYPFREGRMKIIGELPRTLQQRSDLTFEDLKPYLFYSLGVAWPNISAVDIAAYSGSAGLAEKFRKQRCFLIGDAAHVHSWELGQGLNNAFQDAHNLAWKLAGVIKKEYNAGIMDTYSSEAELYAKQALAAPPKTDHFNRMSRLKRSMNLLGMKLLGRGKDKEWPGKLLSIMMESAPSYREGKLSVHYSKIKSIKAGDRLPFIRFYDEKLNSEVDLHSWCYKTGFTLLVIGRLNDRDLFLLARWIKQTYPFTLNFFYLPPSEKNRHIFDFFEISGNQKITLIVRPDLHIGYISDAVVIEMVDNYLREIVGMR